MAQWCHVATLIWDSIGSGNDLLPVGTKPLPETMLNYHQCSLPDLPGADELKVFVFTNIVSQLWGHHVYVCYGQMMGANKPSRVSVPWIFVLLICNNWNKRLLNLNLILRGLIKGKKSIFIFYPKNIWNFNVVIQHFATGSWVETWTTK